MNDTRFQQRFHFWVISLAFMQFAHDIKYYPLKYNKIKKFTIPSHFMGHTHRWVICLAYSFQPIP